MDVVGTWIRTAHFEPKQVSPRYYNHVQGALSPISFSPMSSVFQTRHENMFFHFQLKLLFGLCPPQWWELSSKRPKALRHFLTCSVFLAWWLTSCATAFNLYFHICQCTFFLLISCGSATWEHVQPNLWRFFRKNEALPAGVPCDGPFLVELAFLPEQQYLDKFDRFTRNWSDTLWMFVETGWGLCWNYFWCFVDDM